MTSNRDCLQGCLTGAHRERLQSDLPGEGQWHYLGGSLAENQEVRTACMCFFFGQPPGLHKSCRATLAP